MILKRPGCPAIFRGATIPLSLLLVYFVFFLDEKASSQTIIDTAAPLITDIRPSHSNAGSHQLLALGDSLTAGSIGAGQTVSPLSDRWINKLHGNLIGVYGGNWDLCIPGVPGATSTSVLITNAYKWQDLTPDLVTIELGVNDSPPHDTATRIIWDQNVTSAVNTLSANGVPVRNILIFGLPPQGNRSRMFGGLKYDSLIAWNVQAQETALRLGCTFVPMIDVYDPGIGHYSPDQLGTSAPFLDDDTHDPNHFISEIDASDTHPNNAGYEMWYAQVLRYLPSDILPTDTVYSDSAIISVSYKDPTPSAGIDISSVSINLNGQLLTGCRISETNLSCPVSQLSYGLQVFSGSVSDFAGNQSPINGSFTVADNKSPQITYSGPSGIIHSESVAITADLSDPAPSSGIDLGSVEVLINGGPAECQVDENQVRCDINNITDGQYSVNLTARDREGNENTIVRTFEVDAPPKLQNITATTSCDGSASLRWSTDKPSSYKIQYSLDPRDLSYEIQDPSLSTIHEITLGGFSIEDQLYYRVISYDDSGFSSTSAVETATIRAEKPPLRLTLGDAKWDSYSNYVERILSVDYTLGIDGSSAHSIEILGAVNTNGVILSSGTPVSVFDIHGLEVDVFGLEYLVPPGVSSFRSTIFITAKDSCGDTFEYPGHYASN